jgi:hypothetical protein
LGAGVGKGWGGDIIKRSGRPDKFRAFESIFIKIIFAVLLMYT